MRKRILFLLAALFAFALASDAQVLVVGDFNVKPGKEADFIKAVEGAGVPAYAPLLKDGTLLAWGISVPVFHTPGDATHSVWYVAKDFTSIDRVQAALTAQIGKSQEDYKKAVEDARKKRTAEPRDPMQAFMETVDMSAHKDWVFRIQLRNASAAPPSGMGYAWINLVKVYAGQAPEWRAAWDKYVKPTYDKLLKEGAINGYEIGTEELKSQDAFTHYVLVALPNLAAREKVRAAFAAVNESRSEELRRAIGEQFRATSDPSAARQFVLRDVKVYTAGN